MVHQRDPPKDSSDRHSLETAQCYRNRDKSRELRQEVEKEQVIGADY
jgi:hypothetical protein